MQDPCGSNNGRISEKEERSILCEYFKCKEKHGVLTSPKNVAFYSETAESGEHDPGGLGAPTIVPDRTQSEEQYTNHSKAVKAAIEAAAIGPGQGAYGNIDAATGLPYASELPPARLGTQYEEEPHGHALSEEPSAGGGSKPDNDAVAPAIGTVGLGDACVSAVVLRAGCGRF